MPNYSSVIGQGYQPEDTFDIESGGKKVTSTLPSNYRNFARIVTPKGIENWMGIPTEESTMQDNTLPEWSSTPLSPEKLVESEYESGKASIQSKFLMTSNTLEGIPKESPQYQVLLQDAVATHHMEMNELNEKLQKSKMAIFRVNNDPTFSFEDKQKLIADYHSRNPVYTTKDIDKFEESKSIEDYITPPSRGFTMGHIQKAMSNINRGGVFDEESQVVIPFTSKEGAKIYAEQNLPPELQQQANTIIDKIIPEQPAVEPQKVVLSKKPTYSDYLKKVGKTVTKTTGAMPISGGGIIAKVLERYGNKSQLQSTGQEPLTQDMFIATVSKLKATNPQEAKIYYDKWASKWQ